MKRAAFAVLLFVICVSAVAEQTQCYIVDLGPPGVDDYYGFGMVDAVAASRWLAPAAFGLPPRPDLRTHAAH